MEYAGAAKSRGLEVLIAGAGGAAHLPGMTAAKTCLPVLGVPLRAYVAATFLGIIPGTTAYSVAGSGLGSVIEAQNRVYQACLAKAPANPDVACPYTIDTSALVTRELVLAFILLGCVALVPALMKKWRERNAAA